MEELPNFYDLSAEQQDTAMRLEQLLGKTVADRYVDFCRLAAGAFSLRVPHPIAAHALRELESTIRGALVVPLKAYPPEETETDTQRRENASQILIDQGFDVDTVKRASDALKPRIDHKEQILNIVTNLGLATDGDIAKSWLSIQRLSGGAHKRSFHHSLSVDDKFRSKYQQPFEIVIRAIVIALQSRYSLLMLRVEEIAAMQKKSEAVKCYKNEIPGALPLQWHFFTNLQTPDWIPPLAREGLLGEPIADLNQNGSGMPLGSWPAGDYLLRMAKSSDASTRKHVIKAVRNIAKSKNSEVQKTGLEILAILPPDDSAQLVDIALTWIDRDADFFSQQGPCHDLLINLADGGQNLAALRVARVLLQIWDQDGQIGNLFAHEMFAYYLPEFVQVLTKACGEDALRFFSDLLEQAASISGQIRYDHLLLQPITDDEMADQDIYYALRRAVRQSAEILVGENAYSMRSIIILLANYSSTVFRRIALHLLAKNPSSAFDLAESYLTSHELIEADWCNHEYAELALAWYPSLKFEMQQEVLRVVDLLPEKYRSGWTVRFEEREKRLPTEEEVQIFNALTIRDTVWKWRDVLPADRQEMLSKIVLEHGSPDAWRERMSPIAESPLTEMDFLNCPVVDIVAFLKSWHPGDVPRQQTSTALAQKLRLVAERDSKRYAAEADKFSDIAPIYVRHFLEGIKNSVGTGNDLIHENVLKLIHRTFSRMHEPINDFSVTEGDDPNWLWACTAGAELLQAGLGRGGDGINYQYTELVQSLIFLLLERAPQQPELKDFEERFQRDAYFGAAATLRGAAIELCIFYISWLNKNKESLIASVPQDAFKNMKSIRIALEMQLEDVTPNGRIPRAILGKYLNWIFYYGRDWLFTNLEKLFSASDAALRQSAWLAHLGHDQGPSKELMPQLLKFYEDEIASLANSGKNNHQNYYHKRLVNNLILLYLWNVLPEKLIEQFWLVSPASLRHHAMWFLGGILGLTIEQLPGIYRARGFLYWERRLGVAKSSSQPDSFREELGAIGQWCSHEQIDREWLSVQLLAMLKAGFAPKSEFGVVKWLAKLSQNNTDRAVEVLEALLTSQHVNLIICMTQRESIRTILAEGIANGTEETSARSQALVSFLSSKGETRYLELVHSSD